MEEQNVTYISMDYHPIHKTMVKVCSFIESLDSN